MKRKVYAFFDARKSLSYNDDSIVLYGLIKVYYHDINKCKIIKNVLYVDCGQFYMLLPWSKEIKSNSGVSNWCWESVNNNHDGIRFEMPSREKALELLRIRNMSFPDRVKYLKRKVRENEAEDSPS